MIDTAQVVTQKCKLCSTDYEAHHKKLGLSDFDTSQGLCPECFKKHFYKEMTCQCFICHKTFTGTFLMIGARKHFVPRMCPECYEQDLKNTEAVRLSALAGICRKWRETSGIAPKFMQQGFETFVQDKKNGNTVKILNVCKDYAKAFPPVPYSDYVKKGRKAYPSLLLFSTLDMVGVGKTHLVSSIAHAVLNQWKGEGMMADEAEINYYCRYTNPVMFVSEYELYRRIQATYNYSLEEKSKKESELDIIRQLIFRDLLIIDDIGKEPRRDMDFVQRILFAIIDGRYKNMRPIVMTTNKTPGELKAYLGEASFDRIYEMVNGHIWQVEGKSYRQKI